MPAGDRSRRQVSGGLGLAAKMADQVAEQIVALVQLESGAQHRDRGRVEVFIDRRERDPDAAVVRTDPDRVVGDVASTAKGRIASAERAVRPRPPTDVRSSGGRSSGCNRGGAGRRRMHFLLGTSTHALAHRESGPDEVNEGVRYVDESPAGLEPIVAVVELDEPVDVARRAARMKTPTTLPSRLAPASASR